MLSDNARQMGPLREKLQWVEVWLNRRHLSDQLGRRVRAYYTEIWAHHKGQPLSLALALALMLALGGALALALALAPALALPQLSSLPAAKSRLQAKF